jgi:transcription elongation GreA/GreB family factor
METLIVTAPSYEKRKSKHEEYSKRIKSSIEDKQTAREQGDLSENFGYVEAKNEIERYRRMQAELGLHTNNLQIVDPKEWAKDTANNQTVQVGKIVDLSINNYRETLLIGGAWDSDLNADQIVPYTSPLAKCLLTKKSGDTAKLVTNNAEIQIHKIQTPTEGFLQKLYGKKVKETQNPDIV